MDAGLREQVRIVLQRGLERVRTHWAAGDMRDSCLPDGYVCAATALWIDPATGTEDHVAGAEVAAARSLLRRFTGEPSLTLWNDAQTSNAPVVALYERAIAALDAEEASG